MQPSSPQPKCRTRSRTLAASQTEKGHPIRYVVRIESVRKRLLDEDNLCPKYHIDSLRYSGVLPSDAPGRCKIEISQRKPAKDEAEATILTIIIPPIYDPSKA